MKESYQVNIIPIMNNTNTNVSCRGKFQTSGAINDYVNHLGKTDLKLFKKNQALMEKVNDGKEYLYKLNVTYDKDCIERVRAEMYENGKLIISEIKAEYYFDASDNEISREYNDAAKKVFDKLFSRYNPNLKSDEQKAYKKIDKLKQSILSKMEKESK